jgi:hypothetical protein
VQEEGLINWNDYKISKKNYAIDLITKKIEDYQKAYKNKLK